MKKRDWGPCCRIIALTWISKLTLLCSVTAPTASGTVLGTFCGRVGNEQPIRTTRNYGAIKFTTDFSVTRRGFSMQYKSGKDVGIEHVF